MRILGALGVALLVILPLSGCTPDKAKAVIVAANQFKAEANKAIDGIVKMHEAELSVPADSSVSSGAAFARGLFELDTSTKKINPADLTRLVNPYVVQIDPEVRRQWDDFIVQLKGQYATFAAIFTNLDRGYLLGADAVKHSVVHAERLTAQLIGIAEGIDRNPPILLQHWSALIKEGNRLRAIGAANPERTPAAVRLRDQVVALQDKENELRRSTIEQCLKAAAIGMELRKILQDYDRLSLDDLNFYINRAFQTASSLTGKDYGSTKAELNETIQRLKGDSLWKQVIEEGVLEKASLAAQQRPN
jgi:hypothetical protein